MEIKKKSAESDYEINKLLTDRWSPRTFSGREISDEEIHQLFEAARWAASSSNYQPWRFMYARRGTEIYTKMFDCLSDFNKKWVNNAPVLLFAAFKKRFENGKENFHALHDLGLSMGNFGIQAQDMGIAIHQMAGVNWKKAHQIFEVNDEYHIATAIAVGYYGGDNSDLNENLQKQANKKRTRKDQSEFVFKDKWENK